MRQVFDSGIYKIEHDPARRLVVIRRSSVSLASVDIDTHLPMVTAALRPLRGQRLLIDVRMAPGNNNPAFEQRIQEFRHKLAELFPVRASLVATATGRLQLSRMSRERGEPQHDVFLDENEAILYLMAQPT